MAEDNGQELDYKLGHVEAERLKEAEKAYLSRPRLSIRLRIVAGFLLCFFLLAVTGIVNLAILYQARGKLHFLDISQDLSLEIQQSRHFALTEFPNKANLDRARDFAKKSTDLLMNNGPAVLNAAGEKDLSALNLSFGHYLQLLDDSLELAKESTADPARRVKLDQALDTASAGILNHLRTLKAREAAGANHVLRISQELPFLFSVIMLLIIFWITSLLAKTITSSLERLQKSTRRIAEGDFTLMNPRRRYHDEFSDLSLAVNRMLLELRAREAQVLKADKLASVGAFTEGIAGELNTVLDTIYTNVENFMEACKPRKECPRFGLLEDIFSETRKGRETVNDLLAYLTDDRFEAGPVSLRQLVESAHRLLESQMAMDHVEFVNHVPETLPEVMGAFNPLKHVLLNLFHNAIQAMPEGGALEVNASRLDRGRIELTVTDQGVGIPAEALEHIFDPLFSTKEGKKGTGLGLSISYSIIKKHEGDIRVSSLEGKGTAVHITLPLAEKPVPAM